MTTMIGYLRVSAEEQTSSDAGLSAKSLKRPQLQAALTRLNPKKRYVDGIVVAKLDRLRRSVHDFSGPLRLANART